MMSPKTKIGLLLAAHVVCGLIFASIAQPTNGDFAIYGLFALTFADAGLLGMWGGLGLTRFGWRLPAVIGATVYPWSVFVVILDLPDRGKLTLFLTIALTTVTIAVVLSCLRHSRRKLRVGHLAEALPMSEGFQFSIRHLLVATAIVAAVLGLGRVVRAFGNERERLLVIGLLPPCLILVEVATLWAALGIGRTSPRLAVVLPAAFMVGAIPIFYLKAPAEQILPFVICIGLSAIITAASLLVVRSCGWRLVRGGGVQTDVGGSDQCSAPTAEPRAT